MENDKDSGSYPTPLSATIPVELKRWLEERSRKERRSIASIVSEIIAAARETATAVAA